MEKSEDSDLQIALVLCQSECEALEKKIEALREATITLKEISETKDNSTLNFSVKTVLSSHYAKVQEVHWFTDSRHVVSVGTDGLLSVTDTILGNRCWSRSLPSWKQITCSVDPSGQAVCHGGIDCHVAIFILKDLESTTEASVRHNRADIRLLEHEGYISHCKFIDDFSLVSASGDCTAIIWDVELEKPKLKNEGHSQDLTKVDVFENGFVFLTAGCDAEIRLWDVREDSKSMRIWRGETDIDSIKLLPGDKAVGAVEASWSYLLDLRTYRKLNHYEKSDCHIGTDLEFSKSGKYLFVTSSYGITIWDTLSAECLKCKKRFNTRSVSCSPEGTELAFAGWDGEIQIWGSKKKKLSRLWRK